MKNVVIDNAIFWDGSLNVLSYNKTKERMTRWFDPTRAANATEMYDLRNCAQCRLQVRTAPYVCITGDNAGASIRRRRMELCLSKSEFARLVTLDRKYLAEIEDGKRCPGLEVFIRIFQALGRTVVWVPPAVIGSVERIIELEA